MSAARIATLVALLLLSLFADRIVSGQMIVAHRGASFDAPENTLAAFRLAFELGADGIEGDFRLTADGKIVCIHDEDTARTGDRTLVVADSTLADLQSVDVGSWKDSQWSAERPPTLDEIIEILPQGKKFFIELKTGPEIVPALQQALRNAIESDRIALDQCVVISFEPQTINACKTAMPALKCHWLTSHKRRDTDDPMSPWVPSRTRALNTLAISRADGIGSQARPHVFDAEFIATLSDSGVDEFHVWTVDDIPTAKFYQQLGAVGITTNRPDFIRKGLESRPPNIVLVMADDQGYGDTGFTGHPVLKTPNMDAMAAAGIVFNRFYSGAPVCSPTRASVMTGRNPVRVNVPNHGRYLRPHETTIAEALKSAGYVTGHFGKWHIGSVQAESPTSPGGQGFDEWLSGLNFFDVDPYLSRAGRYEQIEGQGTVISMDATIDFLNRHKDGEQPMFAVTWFPSPHDPHAENPEGEDVVLYEGEKAGYYREIQLIDQQLGRLRESLREMGIADNTILWYCSDNGGLNAATSGGRAKKGSVYEGGLRIPSIIEWPAAFSPQQIDVPAITSDMYPTLISLAGAQVENQPVLDGINLAGVIAGTQTERPAMGFWHKFSGGQATWSDRLIKQLMEAQQAGEPNPLPERLLKDVNEFPELADDRFPGHAALNAWPWKIHRIEDDGGVRYELYHLIDDPMEQNDLASVEPQQLEKLKTELEAWQSSVLRSLEGADYVDMNR